MAFVLLNPPRRWFDTPQTVIVDQGGMASVTDNDNGVSAATQAVRAWGNMVNSTTGSPDIALGDGVSHLVFSDPLNVCKGRCLAATTTGFYDSGQSGTCGGLSVVAITDSDVVFNTRYDYTTTGEPDGCSGEIFLESVTTHEVGHLIGLGHSSVASALMAPSVASCDNKTINFDDRDGRDALYGCNLSTDPGPPGQCELGQKGDSCLDGSDCCSGNCKGKSGAMTCK